jgi:hypothetical protein
MIIWSPVETEKFQLVTYPPFSIQELASGVGNLNPSVLEQRKWKTTFKEVKVTITG